MSSQLAAHAPRKATFRLPQLYPLSLQGTAWDLASADFTGTGVKDIVVADGASGAVSLLENHGDGTFAAAVTVHSESGSTISAIATGDFNNDGHSDIVIVAESSSGQELVLLLGDGQHHFRTSARARLENLGQMGPLRFGGSRSIAVGAFTHAGVLDAAVTDGVNDVSVFSGDGKGGFTGRRDLLAAALPVSIVGANLFGHALMDLGIVDNDSSSVYTFANRGNGTFDPRQRSPLEILPINAQPVSLAYADFRGDGRTDLFAVYSATGTPVCNCVGKVLLSDGHGSYAKAVDVSISGHVDFPRAGVAADFNGDGIADLGVVAERVGSTNYNDVIVLPGNGNGTFSTTSQTTAGVPPPGSGDLAIADKMIVGDFKGDGKPSIAFSFDRAPGWGVAVLINTTK
jgi:hypothetical protein